MDSEEGDNEFTPFRNIMNGLHARDPSKKVRTVMEYTGNSENIFIRMYPMATGKAWMNSSRWIIDDEAAAIVKQIYAWCLDSYGPELDKLFQPIYEDNVKGKLTDE